MYLNQLHNMSLHKLKSRNVIKSTNIGKNELKKTLNICQLDPKMFKFAYSIKQSNETIISEL